MGIGRNFPGTVSIAEAIDPDQRGAGTVWSGWWQVKSQIPISAVFLVGEIAAGGTFDAVMQQATDGSGSGAKALKTAAQLPDTGDNQQITITADLTDLDQSGGFSWVRIGGTVAVANVDWAALLMQYWNTSPTGAELDASTVAESL